MTRTSRLLALSAALAAVTACVAGGPAPRPAATVIPAEPARGGTEAGPSGNLSRPTPAPPAATPELDLVTQEGTIWFAAESFGPDYLAIPIGRGHLVTVCGPAACWTTVSTDAGPALFRQREGRIADVAVGQWERLCGVPRRFGGCPGSWTVVARAVTPPPTETKP